MMPMRHTVDQSLHARDSKPASSTFGRRAADTLIFALPQTRKFNNGQRNGVSGA
jgi:hypothetical protein